VDPLVHFDEAWVEEHHHHHLHVAEDKVLDGEDQEGILSLSFLRRVVVQGMIVVACMGHLEGMRPSVELQVVQAEMETHSVVAHFYPFPSDLHLQAIE